MNLAERLVAETIRKRRTIVVIGDVMVDRWVHGHLAECQDGCEKFVQEEIIVTPGGAANAERCLSRWDVTTVLYGYAANDCPIKTRYVQAGKIVFRHDDDGSKSRVDNYRWSHELALEMVRFADGVLLSDYDKGFLTPAFIRDVAATCKRRGASCVADVKREPGLYEGCVLKGNANWFRSNSGYSNHDQAVRTSGENSPTVFTRVPPHHMLVEPAPQLPTVKLVNHVGAGDCFAAHLTLALACRFSLREAAAIAHSAGRVYVQFPHNRPPYPAEVIADMATAT